MSRTIIIPKPHSPGQKQLIISDEIDVVFAGRRYGKTHCGVQRIIRGCLRDPGLYWWVGLGWKSASLKRAWREIKQMTVALWEAQGGKPEDHIHESAKEVDLPGGSEIWMRTAERPDSLAGEGIKGVIVDEFTLMQEVVWTEYIEATLLDHQGWALFIGVPKGNNWGARLWRNCANREGWNAHHYTTADNPSISAKRLEDIKKNTPSKLYEQEYEAQVVDGAGVVFSNIFECINDERLMKGNRKDLYVMGLDWGKTNDYTVATVMDITKQRMVHFSRFNEVDYPTQLERVRTLNELFKPRCIVSESNSMGEPLCDQLIRDGLPIEKFFTNNKSKREIIERLVVAFEQTEIGILDEPPLLKELEQYESKVTAHGNITYSAPKDEHDDCVMSLALAWHHIKYDTGISL